jgi:DNA invertase Pin-like site-specific DNA recombinase
MMKAVMRRELDMVAAWSVDRLGQSLTDLLEFLKELHAKEVDLFLHQQGARHVNAPCSADRRQGCERGKRPV